MEDIVKILPLEEYSSVPTLLMLREKISCRSKVLEVKGELLPLFLKWDKGYVLSGRKLIS